MPEQGRDFIVLIFPPDDFDFPVVQVIRARTGFKLIPVRRSDSEFWRRIMGEEAAGGKELTAALECALKKYLKGKKVSDRNIKREIGDDRLKSCVEYSKMKMIPNSHDQAICSQYRVGISDSSVNISSSFA